MCAQPAEDGIARATGHGGAYEQIREAIVEGRYAPGQRLVEQRLAGDLVLSRTPVREALLRLEAEGLVVSEKHRGAIVRPVTAQEVEDLYALRTRLESLAAECAARRRTASDITELDEAVLTFEAAIPAAVTAGERSDLGGTRELTRANGRFHEGVLAAARSDRLTRVLAGSVDVPLVFQSLRRFNRPQLERSALFHGLIRDAIVAQEPDRAGRLMTEHVLQGRDALLVGLGGDAGAAAVFDGSAGS
jgi:DNA-binding GntR family transcriptional regulator